MGTENEYVNKFKNKAEKLGMSEHIVYTGWITGEELKAAYHSATVVAVPTVSFEPLSMVAIEAMVCAKPVIGSCYGGIAEVVEDGVTGYLVHPLDTELLSKKFTELFFLIQKRPRVLGMQEKNAKKLSSRKRFISNV